HAVNSYRQLDEAQILATLMRLRARISERFADSGLARVATELLAVGHESAARVEYLRRPLWPVRAAVAAVLAAIALVLVAIATTVRMPTGINGLAAFVQATESAINDLLFLAAAVFFLITLETRLKRRKAFAAIHELRSIAHIVDMHQLTKDPEHIRTPPPGPPASPVPPLTP